MKYTVCACLFGILYLVLSVLDYLTELLNMQIIQTQLSVSRVKQQPWCWFVLVLIAQW